MFSKRVHILLHASEIACVPKIDSLLFFCIELPHLNRRIVTKWDRNSFNFVVLSFVPSSSTSNTIIMKCYLNFTIKILNEIVNNRSSSQFFYLHCSRTSHNFSGLCFGLNETPNGNKIALTKRNENMALSIPFYYFIILFSFNSKKYLFMRRKSSHIV